MRELSGRFPKGEVVGFYLWHDRPTNVVRGFLDGLLPLKGFRLTSPSPICIDACKLLLLPIIAKLTAK